MIEARCANSAGNSEADLITNCTSHDCRVNRDCKAKIQTQLLCSTSFCGLNAVAQSTAKIDNVILSLTPIKNTDLSRICRLSFTALLSVILLPLVGNKMPSIFDETDNQ